MMKTGLVHDLMLIWAGAEAVLEQLDDSLPDSDLFFLMANPALVTERWPDRKVTTSFLQKLPKALTHHRYYLPLFPLAVEQFDLTTYDLVVSSSYAVAKGVLTSSEQLHICYCHAPMRCVWDLYHFYRTFPTYRKRRFKYLSPPLLHYLRLWDTSSAARVDLFVANSQAVQRRIAKQYRRSSTLIYPPCDLDFFSLEENKERFYVMLTRLVPYKRVDLVIDTFASMPDRRLLIIGDGPERAVLERQATQNIELLGALNRVELRPYLQKARALIVAGVEDFGIATVEAQSCGTPVLAYGQGGSLENVVEGKSGLFFREPTTQALRQVIDQFERELDLFDPRSVRETVHRFSVPRFHQEWQAFVEKSWGHFLERGPLDAEMGKNLLPA